MEQYTLGRKKMPIRINPANAKGKGGEADIFQINDSQVAKIFKRPDHADYAGNPNEQEGARRRIDEHQRKLTEFPQNLPPRVLAPNPDNLVYDRAGKVAGYAMPFLKGFDVLLSYGDRAFGQAVPYDQKMGICLGLHESLRQTHPLGVIFGDFNDLNILVRGSEAWIIDVDSAQFGSYLCRVFTEKFVDPLLCDSTGKRPMLNRPFNSDSDWYAFDVMLMATLLYVGPYGGIFKPGDKSKLVPHDQRPLKRITVFHPDVKYPKPAVHWRVLPDDLLQHFHQRFENDVRGQTPLALLEKMRWTTCSNCGIEHARAMCPECFVAPPAAIKEVTVVRGIVIASTIFKTKGVILHASYQEGNLRWLYHENGEYRREGGAVVTQGKLDPQVRYRIKDKKTLIGKENIVVILSPGEQMERVVVDMYGQLPIFDSNDKFHYWSQNGQLRRNDPMGEEYIGDVLQNQTLFWVGPTFGFGFYRAGEISMAFVFDAQRKRSLNDQVNIQPIRGQLVDATCIFSPKYAWFFTTSSESGKLMNRCTLIEASGKVLSTAETEKGSDHWLGNIRGSCAINKFLLVPTDEGIVRVEEDNSQLTEVKKFPDTESFVDSSSFLYPGADGLYVIRRQEIIRLKLS
ncbi:MAG TPA: hypothetical protein DEA43_02150 [Candidatus Moranbacteria bacterium]|nr:hypothetical protein [Candidatus Moranbacteria bacterium]HBT45666.1 hypothetical protein [Candidatus Moranbacteria bacterium]